MPTTTLLAHFDGKHIRLDEPFPLKRNERLLVTILPDNLVHEREEWEQLAAAGLNAAYGEDEPEYTLDMVREPNPEYEGR